MADNVTLNSGTGGATAATDDVGGVHYQKVKITLGADGVADAEVSSTNPMPVSDNGGALTVDGTVAVTGVATSAKQDTIIGHVDGIEALLGTIDADTGTLAVVGGGAEATALRVTIANDSTGVVSIDDNGGAITVDGTVAVTNAGITTIAGAVSGTEMQVDVVAALPAGNNNIGDVDAIQSGTWTVQPGNTANTTPWLVTPSPATSGGLSLFRSIDLDETEEEVKATAGQVYGMWFTNTATSTRFLKFYNATAANVTVGTTTPVLTLGLPGNSSDDISGVFDSAHGIAFGTAITVAATTGVADNDTGAPGANEVIVNIFYK